MTGARGALVAAVAAIAVAGCGVEGGVLLDVAQAPEVAPVDKLHLYVGVADGDAFAGARAPEDDIALDAPLTEARHTIKLYPGDGLGDGVPVRVAVVGYSGGQPVAAAMLDLPQVPSDYLLAYDVVLGPVGSVWETETGCVGLEAGLIVGRDDRDCDGHEAAGGDCDDANPQIHPGAYDACIGDSLGVDDDCSDVADDGDLDDDGATCQVDCDDEDGARAPGNVEDCVDGIDNNCNEQIDEGMNERCDDGVDNDCDEQIDEMTPEVCADGADNDCDQLVDEGRVGDGGVLDDDIDGDGATCATDCDDDAETVHPGADEVCNQTDDDCDQGIDEAVNTDEDPALCIDDCDDFDETIHPGAYDGCDGDALGRSDDCDEPIDEGDLDNDGVACRDDCDDEDEHRFPGNPEVCDTHVDEDCDPLTEPAPQPCFEYADVNTCFYGFRSCDSSTGTYRDACVSEAETPLPLGVCEGFADCADADDNRLACGADVLHDCDQLLTPDGGLCPEPAFPLDAGAGMTPCTWQLIGGPVQQGWTVGLVPAGGGPPGALVTTCQASFRVIEPPVTGSEGSFAVALSVGGVHQRTEVFVIAPKAEAVCAAPSLVCLTATMP